jgi:hypothetical protein
MKKNSVGLLELETAVLECFLEKTPLSPLGIKWLHPITIQNSILEWCPLSHILLSLAR